MEKYYSLKSVAVGMGILIILVVLCIGSSLLGSVVAIKRTEPYKHSVDLALKSQAVRDALGAPVVVGRFPQGAVNDVNGGDVFSIRFMSEGYQVAAGIAATHVTVIVIILIDV